MDDTRNWHTGHRGGMSAGALKAALLMTLFGLAGSIEAGPPFSKATADGKRLVVADEVATQGRVYHAITGRERQVYFESDAPLEAIKGQSNRVIGYVVASDDGSLAGGEWHLPVDSIRTGIELRDEHLAGKDWLDAETHASIVFQLARTEDVELKKETADFRTYSATLVGEFTIHGVSQPIMIENATVTYLNESDKTRSIAKGDLLAIRAKYTVTLSDFDVSHPVLGSKVADTIEIDTALYMTTEPE